MCPRRRLHKDGQPFGLLTLCPAICPANEVLRAGVIIDRHHDSLSGRPYRINSVLAHVLFEILLGPRCHFSECKLAKRSEISFAEELPQRLLDPLTRVHIAVTNALPKRVRRHIDQFNFVSLVDYPIRHTFSHRNTGDTFHDVREALKMLDINSTDDRDTMFE